MARDTQGAMTGGMGNVTLRAGGADVFRQRPMLAVIRPLSGTNVLAS